MKSTINPAIQRSLKILERLSAGPSARYRELAEACGGISHASLSRLLSDLETLGYVAKVEEGYRLTRGLRPGSGAGEWPEAFQGILEALSRDLGLSAGIFAPLGRTCMTIVARNNVEEGASVAVPGTEMPQYAVHGFAKIFLAHASPAVRHEVYSALARYVIHQKPPFNAWNAALDATAKSGFAVEAMEWQPHVARFTVSVARVISGVPELALGVIGPPESLKNKKAILVRLAAAQEELVTILKPARASQTKLPNTTTARRPSTRIH
ncbi:MAG: helix-turn-helix domain-containing protein [Spirochaetes bacterium]|nr:helix-turn-helix domain-containing protein [Spirochaetota bacterium]